MRKTILAISFILVASLGLIHAQTIFKKYGFNNTPLTLSEGKYKEFFTDDEVVQIGTVRLNTRTSKVIEFLKEDTTKVNYKSEFSSRWLNPDPHAENYYNVSPYVYVNNNPVINIDPDGQDWYQAENGNAMWRRSTDKEYTDANGTAYKNIGTQYIYAKGTNITLFQQKTNKYGEMSLSSITIDTKGNADLMDQMKGVLAMQNSNWSREAAMEAWKNPTISNHLEYLAKEILSQYTNPYLVVGGLSAGVAGLSSLNKNIQFGNNLNQEYHAFRHTDALNIDRAALSATITNDMRSASSQIVTGQPLNRVVNVNGVRVQYTAYKLPNGTINIGRMHAAE